MVDAFADAVLALDTSVPTGTYVDMTANLPVIDPEKISVPTLIMRGQWDGIAAFEDVANSLRGYRIRTSSSSSCQALPTRACDRRITRSSITCSTPTSASRRRCTSAEIRACIAPVRVPCRHPCLGKTREPACLAASVSPQPRDAERAAADALCDFVRRHRRLLVLSGAGVSTASGIPGYRDAQGLWMRAAPVLLHDFLHSATVRQRYWARSMAGWPLVAGARPNGAHRALAQLEAAGHLAHLVTQNVDGLHQRAGSRQVIELHGNIGSVSCLDCGAQHSRDSIQRKLEAENPDLPGAAAAAAADGDAELGWPSDKGFNIPACARCAGMLKPTVIFFGEGVPRSARRRAHCRRCRKPRRCS